MSSPALRYHPLLVLLHWLTALMLLASLGFGKLVLEDVPNSDPEKLSLLRLHMSAGLALLALMLLRLITRFTTRRPANPHDRGPLRLITKISHALLYLFSFAMIVSGLGMAQLGGLFPLLQGQPVVLPESFSVLPPQAGHAIVSTLLLLLIGLHIGAALWHQLVRKDRLLARMGFGPR
jgi:cytochrome b561